MDEEQENAPSELYLKGVWVRVKYHTTVLLTELWKEVKLGSELTEGLVLYIEDDFWCKCIQKHEDR